ncbi:MAG: hypothetical protein AAF557_17200 [Pseudomonadota bacterium]
MRTFDELSSAQAIVSYQRRLEAKGVRAIQITNLYQVIDALGRMGALTNDIEAGGPYVTRWLDPRKNVLSSESSFWIFLLDENDQIVGKIGNRFDRLGRDSFYQYASRALRVIHPEDETAPPIERFPNVAHEISGNLAYTGDLYIHHDWRHMGLVPDLIKLDYWLVATKWTDMDWAVNYVREEHGKKFSWTNAHWMIFKDTVDFSYPPGSPFRGHWFTCATKERFAQLIAEEETRLRSEFLLFDLRNPDFPVGVPATPQAPQHSVRSPVHPEIQSAVHM